MMKILIILFCFFTTICFAQDDLKLNNEMLKQAMNMTLDKKDILKTMKLLVKQGVIDKEAVKKLEESLKNIDNNQLNKMKDKAFSQYNKSKEPNRQNVFSITNSKKSKKIKTLKTLKKSNKKGNFNLNELTK